MDYQVIVEQRARKDADEVLSYIADDSPEAALRWYEQLYERFASLADMPKRCAQATEPELAALGIRQMVFGNYRILHTVNEETRTVNIHHVRHGARSELSASELGRDEE